VRYESLMRFGVFDGLLMQGSAFAKNKKEKSFVSHYGRGDFASSLDSSGDPLKGLGRFGLIVFKVGEVLNGFGSGAGNIFTTPFGTAFATGF